MIRMPYDPKTFKEDDLHLSMSAKGRRPTFNWNSTKKFRETLSLVETGTSGARKASFLRNEDIILEEGEENQDQVWRPQSHRLGNDS